MPWTRPMRPMRQVRRDLVISLLAVVSVGIGVYELMRPRVDARLSLLDVVDLAIVGVFIVDFVRQARASGDAAGYLRRHWWEVPSLIPITGGLVEGLEGIAVLRGVRLVRLVRVVRLLRIVGVAARIDRVQRYVGRVAQRAHVLPLALLGALVVLVGGVVIFLVEGPSDPRFASFGGSLWWSVNVFTTVGNVDFSPTSLAGRVFASILMVLGLAFIGVFTASLASAILKEPPADAEDEV